MELQYLIRAESEEDLMLIGGPFYDDHELEAGVLQALMDHPWDPDPEYWVLGIGLAGEPSLVQFEDGYLMELQERAWLED